jgi:hypothetical protein
MRMAGKYAIHSQLGKHGLPPQIAVGKAASPGYQAAQPPGGLGGRRVRQGLSPDGGFFRS